MAITSRLALGMMNRPNRCQASLLWLRLRNTIPQTYEAPWISPKGVRCAKDPIRRNALHSQGLFAYRTNSGKVIRMYGSSAKGVRGGFS